MKVKCWDFNGRYHEWSLHNYQLTLSPCIQFFPEKSKIHKIPYPNPQPNKRSLLLRLLPITTSQNILFCFLYTEMNHQSMNIRIQAPCPPSPSPSSAFSPRLHHKTPLILRRVICSSEVGSHVMLQTEGSSDVSNSSVTISKHKRTFGWSKKQSLLKQPLNKDSVPLRALLTSSTQDTSPSIVNDGKIGVLLLNLGGPETLDDVQPFLFNLFADPATELRKALYEKNVAAEVYVGMRYWHPFTEEAIKQIKKDGVNKLVVLPLYPQFSISTSGSSLRLLESIFSAHGVPLAYVEEAGDPYKAEMEECVDLIMEELERRKIDNPYTLAYQSRVGPVEWLKPYTDETIIELGEKGVKSLLATLEEIDVEYKELALKSGIEKWGRVPALGCEPTFILDLADAVIESLPYSLVPLGSVEELLATYDSQRRELPAPVTVWEWGWTKSAETWNGRAAMLAVLVLLFLEVSTGEGFLHQWGVLPLQLPMFP
ncbi:Chlorophyll a/b binding protein domain-containing protein [Cynara cardunculus var. scolymus]|uniref:Chlorophyll a/b binding protein domain-containing protein n=1 Tax=Cynara cardunculus var. scolymus TaxID=59895 RepID=A0A103YFD7_CYNCS|nr:Chlorophyll a/b binding protein domain-containing protein [Cynara cardunculus var. scolymus]